MLFFFALEYIIPEGEKSFILILQGKELVGQETFSGHTCIVSDRMRFKSYTVELKVIL